MSGWASARSTAVSAANVGDGDALARFMTEYLVEDRHELANLTYCAHWVGELADPQRDDAFMTIDNPSWTGSALLRHLLGRLDPASPQTPLHAHSLWALLLHRPTIAGLTARERTTHLARLEEVPVSTELATEARHELAGVAYAIRTTGT